MSIRRLRFLAATGILLSLTAWMSAQQTPAVPAAPPSPFTAPVIPMPQILQRYSTVTADRLTRPSDDDWLMIRRTYDGWGYSPLDQITPGTVKRLVPIWSAATGQVSGHEATPIVNRGVMFVSTPNNQVMALDARTGSILWRYRNPSGPELISRHLTNRGIALYEDKVYLAEAECVVVALDAKTGRKLWSSTVGDNSQGYYMSLAPLVAERQDHRRRVGWRARHSRLRRRTRCPDRRARVEGVHGAGARRTRQRDVADRRSMEDRRRIDLGDRQLRSRDEHHLLGHRQWRPVDGRSTPGRQPLHGVDDCHRRRDRQTGWPSPVRPERIVGLG